MVNIPNIPLKFREKVRKLHAKSGSKNFYSKLIKIDPLVKNRINSADTQRSIRAFEIKAFTKKSMYEWFKETKSNYDKKDFFKIYIDIPRNDLLKRIRIRANQMIEKGAILEVKKYIKLKISKDKSANKAIGISEVSKYIEKKIKIEEVIENISIKTRQYAKRQTTWGRGNMQDWRKVKSSGLEKFLKKF